MDPRRFNMYSYRNFNLYTNMLKIVKEFRGRTYYDTIFPKLFVFLYFKHIMPRFEKVWKNIQNEILV